MYGDARIRPFAYTYRDYVIRAFNQDKPWNQFIREQLAADQLDLPAHSPDLAAMGLLTLGRLFDANIHDVIDDQINVVSRGFLGLTTACARCHDHKFDPIPTLDYYSLAGIFNNSTSQIAPIAPQNLVDAYNQAQAEVNRLNNELKKANDVIKKAAAGVTEQQTAHRDTLQSQREAAQKNVPPRYDEAHVLKDIGSNNMTEIGRAHV